MNPRHYTPHVLRMGGCTDKARKGFPGWKIEKWGRWRSKCWKDVYINLDWMDMASLSGISVSNLLKNIQNKPYVD